VQGAVLFTPQLPEPLQTSSVQTFPSAVHGVSSASKQLSALSLQESAHSGPPEQGLPPWIEQVPPPHVSAPLQYRLSLHGAELFGCVHTSPLPSQTSFVQPFASVEHELPADCFASAGQSFAMPSQESIASHSPADPRQAAELLASVGQAVLAPLQVSVRSQIPAEERHVAPALPAACTHAPVPSQRSVEQTSPSPAQAEPEASKLQSAAQQSPPVRFPSSQSSPAVTKPSLQNEHWSAPLQSGPPLHHAPAGTPASSQSLQLPPLPMS
jgi:hypothetical protein